MLHGGCLCGRVSYEIDGAIAPIDYCHCSQCRRASGSAFAANATVASAAFRLTSGAELLREFESSPGKLRVFCSVCGSTLYAHYPAVPTELRLRVGTLSSDPVARASGHYHVASRAPWFTITDELPRYEGDGPEEA